MGTPEGAGLAVIASGFVFGLRHGIDWDHIAAITDLTGTQSDARNALHLSTMYALGHALAVLVLGVAAIEFGAYIPAPVNSVIERVVGVTLLLLGVYVVVTLLRHGRAFRMRSRWSLLMSSVTRAWSRVRHSTGNPVVIVHEHEHPHDDVHLHSHDEAADEDGTSSTSTRVAVRHKHAHMHVGKMPHDPFQEGAGTASALAIGMLHGVGAETPTQILLFLTVAGVGGRAIGLIVLVAFVMGLCVSNTAIALASTYGYLNASRHFPIYATIAVVTALGSLVMGTFLLLNRGDLLPTLLGG